MKKRKISIIGKIGLVCVPIIIIGGIIYFHGHPILLKTGSETVELGSTYSPRNTISYVFMGNAKDVEVESTVDSSKIGTYKTTYNYNGYTLEKKVKVEDTTPPVLKLKNYKTDKVEEVTKKNFIKSVEDASKVKTKIVNQEEDGNKTKITIQAKDAAGNVTEKTCTLTREKDVEAPTFTTRKLDDLEAYETQYLHEMDGIEATDNLDSNPTIVSNAEEIISGPGTYEITYTATDRSGNSTTLTRNVNIKESEEVNEKVVYLTFDDGPSANTERILDILKKYKAKATFFVTGNGQDYNDMIVREYEEGHSVGLHTYTHEYSIYQSEETYFDDLQQVSDMVYNLIGVRSNVIRFPGGSSNTVSASYCEGIMTKLVQDVEDQDYYYFDWNTSSGDAAYDGVPADEIIALAEETSAGQDHIVLLMHDTDAKDTSVEALPTLIEYWKDQGYTFKGLSDMSPECHQGVNN